MNRIIALAARSQSCSWDGFHANLQLSEVGALLGLSWRATDLRSGPIVIGLCSGAYGRDRPVKGCFRGRLVGAMRARGVACLVSGDGMAHCVR